MNAPVLSLIFLALFLNPVSKALLFPYLKVGLDDLGHLFNANHSLVSILFPEPAEANNITIKLGFIGALDKSLGATASLGLELVSSSQPLARKCFISRHFLVCLTVCLLVLFFQSSAFKIAVELINEDAAKAGSQVKFSMDFKSEVLFNQ